MASNVSMEAPEVSTFRKEVLAGNFAEIPQLAGDLVHGSTSAATPVRPSAPAQECFDLVAQKREFVVREQLRTIEYLLYEQKYMELVAQGNTIEAI